MSNNIKLKAVWNAILNTLVGKLILKLIIVLIGGIALATPFFMSTVQENELVMVVRLGELVESPVKPGLKLFYPFINEVYRYDLKQMEFAIGGNDSNNYPEINALSKDQYKPKINASIHYRLNKSKGKEIYYNFGLTDSQEARKRIEGRIENEVRHAILNLSPQYNLQDLIEDRFLFVHNVMYILGFKESFLTSTSDNEDKPNKDPAYYKDISIPAPLASERLSDIGIEINYIQLEFETPEAYTKRRNLETDIQISQKLKEKEMADLDREFERLKKKGEIDPFVLFLEKWDGKLPNELTVDDELVQLLKKKIK